MQRFYVYDPLPTLQTLPTLNFPLLAVFGELDTPAGVKANVPAIRQILDQAGRREALHEVMNRAGVDLIRTGSGSDRPNNRLEIAKRIYPHESAAPVATAPGSDVEPFLCKATPGLHR